MLAAEWSLSDSKVLLKPTACLNRKLGYKLEIVPLALEPKLPISSSLVGRTAIS